MLRWMFGLGAVESWIVWRISCKPAGWGVQEDIFLQNTRIKREKIVAEENFEE